MALHNYFWLSQAEINYITVDSYHHCANPGVRLAQPIDRLVVGSSYTSHVPKLQCVGGEKKRAMCTLLVHAQFPKSALLH